MKDKLRIGFDVSPLYSGHKVRGVGFYTERLVKEIVKLPNYQIVEIKNSDDVRTKKYDILHIPYFHPFFFTVPFKKKRPIIVTIHDLIPIKYPGHYPPGIKGKIRWEIQKILLRKNVDFIITDSFASKYDITDLTGYPQDRIYPIYLAADNKFEKLSAKSYQLKAVKNKYNLPDTFVLYVGDVNWNKNLPGLVKACEKIKIPLVVVGKQAATDDFTKKHIENRDLVWLQKRAGVWKSEIGSSGSLSLLGFVSTSDLVAIYNLATVYCQPSFDEGFGLPILEAFACGCPVVSSDAGSLPEIAKDVASVVKPTVKELARAIKKIIDDKALGDKLKLRGYKRVKDFSWEKTAKKTMFVYRLAREKNL